MARHKCFISFHRADAAAVLEFKERFDDAEDTFIFRGQSMPEDIINSGNDDYVIGEIRRRFLQDSTVTVVLVGRCTWSRKFVDWEVQASLRQPADGLPNGLLAIVLDPRQRANPAPRLPERVARNVQRGNENIDRGYARYKWFPGSTTQLAAWIEDAYQARTTRANLIVNPRGRKQFDDPCV